VSLDYLTDIIILLTAAVIVVPLSRLARLGIVPGFLIAGVLISVAVIFVFNVEPRSALLIGPALALSSTAFVLQLLIEQKMLTSNYGRTSIAAPGNRSQPVLLPAVDGGS